MLEWLKRNIGRMVASGFFIGLGVLVEFLFFSLLHQLGFGSFFWESPLLYLLALAVLCLGVVATIVGIQKRLAKKFELNEKAKLVDPPPAGVGSGVQDSSRSELGAADDGGLYMGWDGVQRFGPPRAPPPKTRLGKLAFGVHCVVITVFSIIYNSTLLIMGIALFYPLVPLTVLGASLAGWWGGGIGAVAGLICIFFIPFAIAPVWGAVLGFVLGEWVGAGIGAVVGIILLFLRKVGAAQRYRYPN